MALHNYLIFYMGHMILFWNKLTLKDRIKKEGNRPLCQKLGNTSLIRSTIYIFLVCGEKLFVYQL